MICPMFNQLYTSTSGKKINDDLSQVVDECVLISVPILLMNITVYLSAHGLMC